MKTTRGQIGELRRLMGNLERIPHGDRTRSFVRTKIRELTDKILPAILDDLEAALEVEADVRLILDYVSGCSACYADVGVCRCAELSRNKEGALNRLRAALKEGSR
jgi:hypothetical protein